jgi:CPA1 family monovalent cation:H+ antiporter
VANAVRQAFTMSLAPGRLEPANARRSASGEIPSAAIQAAREAVLGMRDNREIGDDAFHLVEEDLDWLEMAVGSQPE